MSSIAKFVAASLIIGIFFCCSEKHIRIADTQKTPEPITLLVSLDGFRYDYLDSFDTPNLDALAQAGIKADALLPVFPTKTFPNHYSIVTGLYPEHHGIVGNRMYDPKLDRSFKIGANSPSTRDSFWFEGEPIWVTAKKQGVTTATLFWPGADAAPKAWMPDYHKYYDNTFKFAERVQQVIDWLKIPAPNRPRFITLYFESPDKEGHGFGPFAKETEAAVRMVDQHLGKLIREIETLGMTEQVNLLITSDHGMRQLSRDSVIFIDDYISLSDVTLVETSPKADIIPRVGTESAIYEKLKDAHPKLSVYRKGQEPDRWHYREHQRITPLFAIAEPGWSITTHQSFDANQRAHLGGAHGYDNADPAMWAIFVARGPAFKAGKRLPALENVHLYQLMCHLLGVQPAKNDGDLSAFKGYLTDY